MTGWRRSSYGQAWWVLIDILGLGVFGGFDIGLPPYALIQSRTAENERARVIAATTSSMRLFMVVSAIVSILSAERGQAVDSRAVPGGVAAEHRGQHLHLQDRP